MRQTPGWMIVGSHAVGSSVAKSFGRNPPPALLDFVCLARSCGGREWKARPPWGRTSVSTHPMRPHPGDLAMIITPEQAALKAQQQFDALRDFVQQAARDGQRIDTVEREVFRQLLGLGHTLLSAFVAAAGRRRPRAGGRDRRGAHRPPTARATRPPLRVDLRRVDHRSGRLRHPGGPEDRAGAAGRAAGAARGGLLLRAGGLGPAALPEGVVRRGRSVAGDAPGPAAGDPGVGADEPGRGGVRPGLPGVPGGAPAGGGGAAAGRHRRRQGGADATTAAGRPEAPPPPDQGGEGEQEADGLRRGGLLHRAVREEGRGHHRRGAAGREGRAAAPAAAQARLGRDDPGGRRDRGPGQGGPVLPALRRVDGPQPGARPPGDLPAGRRAGVVGRPARSTSPRRSASWTCSTSWSGSGRWPTASTRRAATRPSSSWSSGCGTCSRGGSGM